MHRMDRDMKGVIDWFPAYTGRYGWLDCVVQVQSVTWSAIVGCPCDW